MSELNFTNLVGSPLPSINLCSRGFYVVGVPTNGRMFFARPVNFNVKARYEGYDQRFDDDKEVELFVAAVIDDVMAAIDEMKLREDTKYLRDDPDTLVYFDGVLRLPTCLYRCKGNFYLELYVGRTPQSEARLRSLIRSGLRQVQGDTAP